MKLEIGHRHSFELREYELKANVLHGFSIVYISDLHLTGRSAKNCTNILEAIHDVQPDLILLGGDYVDFRSGLALWKQFVEGLKQYKVYAVAGNHDYYRGIDEIREIAESKGVVWIENKSVIHSIAEYKIQLDGNITLERRADVDCQILVLHKPWPMQLVSNYDVVFAGHLHGCQFVFWQKNQALYPGRFFYSMNYLRLQQKNFNYFISKGLGDTLPIRYNCKRDFILLRFKKQ